MKYGGLNADVDSGETCAWDDLKSMEQESDESKMCIEDYDSLPFDVGKGVVTSPGVAKLCNELDANNELSEADINKKCNSSSKRLHFEINDDYFVSLNLKRKKNAPESPDDGFVSMVGDSEGGNMSNGEDTVLLDSEVFRKDLLRPNRNREPFSKMLDWLTAVAKDPCHPAVNSLPKRSKWKSHGNEEFWKQVLLAREAISLKRHDDVATEPPNWQVYEIVEVILFFLYNHIYLSVILCKCQFFDRYMRISIVHGTMLAMQVPCRCSAQL